VIRLTWFNEQKEKMGGFIWKKKEKGTNLFDFEEKGGWNR